MSEGKMIENINEGRRDRQDGDWCILRTSGPRTVSLARSLIESGLEAWTPVAVIERRRPRSKVTTEMEAPILPTFVFARREHVATLVAASMSPVNPYPPFSVFKHSGRFPLIADAAITGLRREEDRRRMRKLRTERRSFADNEPVSVASSAWRGMSGVVQSCDGKFAEVSFGGTLSVKIATFLLESEVLEQIVSVPGAKPEPAA